MSFQATNDHADSFVHGTHPNPGVKLYQKLLSDQNSTSRHRYFKPFFPPRATTQYSRRTEDNGFNCRRQVTMASYLSTLWRSLTGNSRPAFNEADFLGALRPRTLRPRAVPRTPKRPPTTPTRWHLPPSRPIPKDDGKKSKQCPHCSKTIYLELPSGRISKPTRTRKGRGKARGKGNRWVSVSDSYKVEDLSPILSLSNRYNCTEEPTDEDWIQPSRERQIKASTKKGLRQKRSDSPSPSPDRRFKIVSNSRGGM